MMKEILISWLSKVLKIYLKLEKCNFKKYFSWMDKQSQLKKILTQKLVVGGKVAPGTWPDCSFLCKKVASRCLLLVVHWVYINMCTTSSVWVNVVNVLQQHLLCANNHTMKVLINIVVLQVRCLLLVVYWVNV